MRRSLPLPQHQLGAERDQGGRHVADRRAVGDIAADRAGVADLDAADPADQLAQIGVEAGQRLLGLGIADARAERERVRALLDPPQIGDVADEDDRAEIARLLGDPQADIGGAGDDPRLGMREQQVGRARRPLRGVDRKPRLAARAGAVDGVGGFVIVAAAGGIGLAGRRGSGRSRCSGTDCRR